MELVRIRHVDNQLSWTIVEDDEPVTVLRDWIIHLEELHFSPNTIEAYARHVARLGTYLTAVGKPITEITVNDYDRFLQWLPLVLNEPDALAGITVFDRSHRYRLSATLKNQIHLAVKSLYRYLAGMDGVQFVRSNYSNHHGGLNSYQPFLEHINQRRSVRQKDRYLSGDLARAQKKIIEKRLKPEDVLTLIQHCHLMRDAFLITLLYNTGMRLGEALGLRHTDVDIKDHVIWIVPRADNENFARAKGGRTRGIPVMPYVTNMYEEYIVSEEYAPCFESGTPYVFCNVKAGRIGRALSRSYAQNLCEALSKRTGVYFNWHMFRHTHASEAIADGYNLIQVADRLGHASPQTTVDFYRHLFSKEVRKLHLAGPKSVQKRLEEFNQAKLLNERAARWI